VVGCWLLLLAIGASLLEAMADVPRGIKGLNRGKGWIFSLGLFGFFFFVCSRLD
jgi:hypothetical protein